MPWVFENQRDCRCEAPVGVSPYLVFGTDVTIFISDVFGRAHTAVTDEIVVSDGPEQVQERRCFGEEEGIVITGIGSAHGIPEAVIIGFNVRSNHVHVGCEPLVDVERFTDRTTG